MRVTLALAAACAVSACLPTSNAGGTAALVGGTAMAIAGTALLVEVTKSDHDTDQTDDPLPDEALCWIAACPIAIGVMAIGLASAIAGMNALSRNAAAAAPIQLPTTADEAGAIDTRIIAPLPDLPVDPATLQLAKQARSAARQGDCATADIIIRRIGERDAGYAHALIASPALARCASPHPG